MKDIVIESEWLRQRLRDIKVHHDKVVSAGIPVPHHGIVPDLICEILKLRGEEVPDLEYPHFPDFVVTKN